MELNCWEKQFTASRRAKYYSYATAVIISFWVVFPIFRLCVFDFTLDALLNYLIMIFCAVNGIFGLRFKDYFRTFIMFFHIGYVLVTMIIIITAIKESDHETELLIGFMCILSTYP